ncbi:MAG: hypothetical protein ACYTBJ_04135 [Planctomycetota bacterium]|jgi:hypothetical protein
MKKEILLIAVVLLSGAALAQAQEGELHGYVGLTAQTKYVWRGFNCFGSQMGAQPEVDLDLYGTGFGLNVQGHIPLGGGYVNFERWDYKPYYRNMAFKDETYETHYMLAYVYYNYPDHPTKGSGSSVLTNHADLQELHGVLSWPKLLGVEGLVPSYVPVKVWPSRSGSWAGSKALAGGSASGWGHILMLDYAWTVPGLMPETPEQVINLHSELVYNDGFHPCGVDIDHEWSNAVFGASTTFDLGNNMSVTPGVYYQITMQSNDNDVNPDGDQFWATMGLKYMF